MKNTHRQLKYSIPIPIFTSEDGYGITQPNRYKGNNRLYKLNLSKMLLRCQQSTYTSFSDNKNHAFESTEKMLVINTATHNTHKINNIHHITKYRETKTQEIYKKNSQTQPRFDFVQRRIRPTKPLAKKLQDITIQLIRKQVDIEQQLNYQKQCQEKINKQQIRSNSYRVPSKYQLLISEKKIHDQNSNQHYRSKPNNFNMETTKINLRRNSQKPALKSKLGLQLPELDIKESNKKIGRNHQQNRNKHHSSSVTKNIYYIQKNNTTAQTPVSKSSINSNVSTFISNIAMLNKDPDQLKIVKSESYAVLQYPTRNLVLSNKGVNNLQIASLTKIMTFYCIIRISKLLNLIISQQNVTINEKAVDTSGTSAEIFQGEVYKVEQLLYGLMLPSGNDAAIALADWGGQTLLNNSAQVTQKLPTFKMNQLLSLIQEPLSPAFVVPQSEITQGASYKLKMRAFLNLMNYYAKQLNLTSSRFANPHGLPSQEAKSTAVDVCRLCAACLDDQIFIKVTSTQIYKGTITYYQSSPKKKAQISDSYISETNIISPKRKQIVNKPTKHTRTIQWENTNKLLRRDGFIGIKTGVTVTAGPCLATAYKFRDKIYITVILRASKVSKRFKQTRKILYWCLTKVYKNNLSNDEKKTLQALKKNRSDFDSDYSEDEHQFNYQKMSSAQLKKRSNFINYEM